MEDSKSVDNEQMCPEDDDENSVLLFSDKENETKQINGTKIVPELVGPIFSSTERDLCANAPQLFDYVHQDITISLSDSSDSVNSLFKTQCAPIPVRNKRKRKPRTFLTKSDVRNKNGYDSASSSDSDEGLWHSSSLKIGGKSNIRKKSGRPKGRFQSSISATEKRKRLRDRGLKFPFVQKEYGTKDLPFKMIFAYEQAALCGLFDYMKELKCQKHLITSLKNINVDCTDRDSSPMRQYKYLDEKRPISPISESRDDTCIEDVENEEVFDVKIVDNSCFIKEKRTEKKKECFGINYRNSENKNRSVKSSKNKYKPKANGKNKDRTKNKQVTVEQKKDAMQNVPLPVHFKPKTSEIAKEKIADQRTADSVSIQNTHRPLDEQEGEGTETTLSLKNHKSNKHSKKKKIQKRAYIASQEENIQDKMDCELTKYQKVLYNGTAERNIFQERDGPVEQGKKEAHLSSLSRKNKFQLYNVNGYFTGSPL